MWSWFGFGIWYLCEKYPFFYIFEICLVQPSPYIQFHKNEHPSKPASYKNLSMQSNQNPVPLSLASLSTFIASHIQSVQFDHVLHHTQSSRPWCSPIRSVPSSQCMDALLVGLTSCSCSPCFCYSFGPSEQNPVLQFGSLSLSPFMARWRFYGGMQDIHQCGYGTRPSGTLICCPGKNRGTSPWTSKLL